MKMYEQESRINPTDIYVFGRRLGQYLECRYPAVRIPDMGTLGAIPEDGIEPISEAFTAVIAEALQVWLNAGSEREMILENLYDHIHREVKSWSVSEIPE